MSRYIRLDEQFDSMMVCDLKVKIAEAFLELEKNIRVCEWGTQKLDAQDIRLVKEKANQMKGELTNFIDSQVYRLINESKVQSHIVNQETE